MNIDSFFNSNKTIIITRMVITNKILIGLILFLTLIFSLNGAAQAVDSDGDGVSDANDLCSGTTSGITVNNFGCPTSISTCDYTTSSFNLNVVGAIPIETRYLLVNSATGIIEQINTGQTFSGLSGTNTYMVLAYSYNGTVSGLNQGGSLSGVSASCQDFSNALMVKVCVASSLPTINIPTSLIVNENVGTVTLTVTLSGVSNTPVSVNYSTSNSTALSGTDYSSSNGTLIFAVGETSKIITLPIIDDTNSESTESFTVTLSSPSGATIANGTTTIDITDNEPVNNDSDGDGVSNVSDLCPNTPSGTIVNAYGCPTSISNCDYNSSSVTFVSTSIPVGKSTRYVLADAADGKIVQVSPTPTFSNLIGTKTYMVLAYSYENDGTMVNLLPNNYLNQVSASCSDWSNALMVKICVPFIPNNNCDYTTSSITLNTTAPAPSGAVTKYILVNSLGTITNISNTTTFTELSGTNTYNAYSISYIDTINNLNLGSNFSNVSGNCYDWSSPLSIKVCVCKPTICLPVTITKIK